MARFASRCPSPRNATEHGQESLDAVQNELILRPPVGWRIAFQRSVQRTEQLAHFLAEVDLQQVLPPSKDGADPL